MVALLASCCFFSLNFGFELEKFTWTTIKSRMSAKFGQIRPLSEELAAFEPLEKYPLTSNGRHVVNTVVPSFFDWIFFFLVGNNDMYKRLDGFEFQPDTTTDYGVTCT